MPVPADETLSTQLRTATAALARIATADLTRPVPACPGWTMRELATHVGRGHRWAAEIVATGAQQYIPFREVPNGKLPEGQAAVTDWLAESAELVVSAVAAAGGGAVVWTFVGSRPAGFWLRRRAHEVTVHLADAQLATGAEPAMPAGLAADGVGEWLEIVSAGGGEGLRGDGETLHFHATDPGLAGTGEWLVRRTPEGATAGPGHAKADVAVRGPAARLLLVVARRVPATDPAVEVFGDKLLLEHWLANTQF